MEFVLHPRLARDADVLGDLPLCRLLGMNNARYPWCVLVPRRTDIREVHELPVIEQQQLLKESSALGIAMMEGFAADKLNVAALGNVVPQLHVHHIARFRSDDCWPDPVWGRFPALTYEPAQWQAFATKVTERLTDLQPIG